MGWAAGVALISRVGLGARATMPARVGLMARGFMLALVRRGVSQAPSGVRAGRRVLALGGQQVMRGLLMRESIAASGLLCVGREARGALPTLDVEVARGLVSLAKHIGSHLRAGPLGHAVTHGLLLPHDALVPRGAVIRGAGHLGMRQRGAVPAVGGVPQPRLC